MGDIPHIRRGLLSSATPVTNRTAASRNSSPCIISNTSANPCYESLQIVKNPSAEPGHCYLCNMYNVWPGPVSYEPWTVCSRSTESRCHNTDRAADSRHWRAYTIYNTSTKSCCSHTFISQA